MPYPGKGVCAYPVKRDAILEGEERRDKMRKWQETKEDYPFMASRCEHAQSKLACTIQEEACEYIGDIVFVYILIVFIVSGK